MPWTRKDFPASMTNLPEHTRDKAIEMANALVDEGYEDGRAIPIAISRAKKWANSRGDLISSEVTHHLVPHDDGWAIVREKAKQPSFVFDTKDEAMDKIKDLSSTHKMKTAIHDREGKFQDIY